VSGVKWAGALCHAVPPALRVPSLLSGLKPLLSLKPPGSPTRVPHPTNFTPDGQHLGTISAPSEVALAPGADALRLGPTRFAVLAGSSAAGTPPFDPTAINQKKGLDEAALLRARDVAFLPDEGEGEEAEDAAKEALKTVAKGVTKVRWCAALALLSHKNLSFLHLSHQGALHTGRVPSFLLVVRICSRPLARPLSTHPNKPPSRQAGKLLGKLGKKLEAAVNNAAIASGAGPVTLGLGSTSSPRLGSAGSSGLAPAGSGEPGGSSGTGSAGADKAARWGSIKVLEPGPDGAMWVAYKRGLLEKYSETGALLWSSGAFQPGVASAAAAGAVLWVGGLDGRVWVLDAASGDVLRSWRAHVFPVSSITGGPGPVLVTLARDGSARAWPAAAPDAASSMAWRTAAHGPACLEERRLSVFAGTWNVNEGRPSRAGLLEWLGARTRCAQLAVVGLQVRGWRAVRAEAGSVQQPIPGCSGLGRGVATTQLNSSCTGVELASASHGCSGPWS
jgi:hypothetical protein